MTCYTGTIRSISFTFDGSYLVGADDEGDCLEVVHVESGDSVGKIKDLLRGATAVAWHPSRYWLAWAGDEGVMLNMNPNDKNEAERHGNPGLRIVSPA